MSINTLVTSNTSNNPRRLTPKPYVPAGNTSAPTTYTRPVDWPALDIIGPTDQKFSGLYAVQNTSMEYVSLTITGTGTITIDWGDGTSSICFSGLVIQHQYNYATLGTSVTSRGYKTALINVTTTGNITAIATLVAKPVPLSPNNALPTNWTPKWLDIALGSPNLTSLTIGAQSIPNTVPTILEQISIISINSLFTPGPGLFGFCTSLQSVPSFPLNTLASNSDMNSMFINCISLVTAPNFNLSKNTNFFKMFENCYKLQVVPQIDTSAAINSNNMFYNCYQLKTIPSLNLTNVTNASNMFFSCFSLQNLPGLNFSASLTNCDNMFQSCQVLKYAPPFNTSGCTSMFQMFNGCISLISVPLYNMQNVLTIESIFSGCNSLTNVSGPLNLPKITTLTNVFLDCRSLVNAPILLNTSLVTSTVNMFSGCTTLQYVPLFNTSNVTAYNSMFFGCIALTTIPLFDTSKGITLNNMFDTCRSLVTIPLINTINVINCSSTFSTCRSLQYIPTIDTGNVTNTTSMFNSCSSMINAPTLNLAKVTDMTSMFTSCFALQNANGLSNTSNVINMISTFSSCISLPIGPTLDTSKVINMSGMFQGCTALKNIPIYNTINVQTISTWLNLANSMISVPALNFSNVQSATNPYSSSVNINNINITGIATTHTISNLGLGKTELENYFKNGLGTSTTARTITITGNPGATTSNNKTSGTTAGSNVITMTNTVGVFEGTYLYSVGITTNIGVTFTDATDTVVYTNGGGVNGLADGDNVMFTSISSTTGILTNRPYFVVGRTSTTFQVSLTAGGLALPLTTNGTGAMTIGGATISNQIVTVNANVNVIINGVAGTTGTVVATNRALNQNYASTKNWIITG